MRTPTLVLLVLILSQTPWAPPAAGQEPAARTGWYVVRPGDSIIGITERFLGSSQRWPENWELNPEVEDPHRIRPGQRLRILLGPALPRRSARVATLSREVEEILPPQDWADASLDDVLLQRDGVRTQATSSAELELSDGARMLITENSLVYIRDADRLPAPVDRQAIEIVEGQADLEALPAGGGPSDVEILVGGSVARPRRIAGEPLQTRARSPKQGGAQFMIYRGESEVEAGGSTVEVAPGMGTTVPKGGAPAPPEELLPPPRARSPHAGARITVRPVDLEWEEVPGAVDYTVEVCGDPSCGRLIRRVVGHRETRWRAAELPLGKLFWRATATSPSGLDGFPGESRVLEVVDGPPDTEPPQVALHPRGRSLQRGAVLYLGAGAGLEVGLSDEGGTLSRAEVLLDGERVGAGVLQGPWAPGRHALSFDVVDAAGNPSRQTAATFVYDPDPPDLSWQPVGAAWRGDRGMTVKAWPRGGPPPPAEASREGRRSRRKKRDREVELSPLQWSGAGWGWQNLDRTWRATGEVEHILLRATEPLTLGGLGVTLAAGDRIKLSFGDATGIAELSFGTVPAEGGGKTLVLEVRDLLDNVLTESWPVAPASAGS